MRIIVDSIVSEKPYGIIFTGTLGSGQQLRVRASLNNLLGIPVAGDTWKIEGEIRQSSYGPQIAATAGRRLLSSGHMIRQFLASHVPGVGQLRAGRLWDAFGENLGEMLSTDGLLDEIGTIMSPDKPLLGQRLAALVTSAWKAAKSEADLVTWLDRQGVRDIAVVRRLQRVLGDTAAQVLAANPYVMVPLLSWKRIDELGRRLLREDGRDPETDARRHVGAADEAVKQMLRRGDTASSSSAFEVAIASLLDIDQRHTAPALAAAITNGAVLVEQDLMRAPGAASLEEDLTARLAALASRPLEARLSAMAPSRWAELLADLTGPYKPLGDEQRAAAVAMMSKPLACMVGGGGTGKTYTCRAVCDLWAHLGGDVLLCALAGKAALRLSRSTGRLAKTLARTLAELKERQEIEERLADPQTTGDEADNDRRKLDGLSQITERTLVVIDEASMVDLPTVHAIARRLLPESRLLCVGDAAQLAPIGFGIVFHKLVEDPSITLRLAQVHRQAAATGIPAAAAVVRAGDMPDFSTFTGVGTGVSFVDCRPDKIAQALDGVVARLGDLADLLVVTATIAGAAGVQETNARFHRRHVDAGHAEMKGFFGCSFSVGEPVIFGKNDYRVGLFNGLMGRVTAIDPRNREVAVMFDGDALPKTLGAELLVDLDLAYAVSCHKCQGSSAGRIVVPIYPSRIIDRSWLYTAITRAEQQVVFVGDRATFATAVAKPPAAELRTTGFKWPAPCQAPVGTRSMLD